MELKQPSWSRRNGSSPTKRSQREFSSTLQMQRSRQGVTAGSESDEGREIQYNAAVQLLQPSAARQLGQSTTADQRNQSSAVGMSTQQASTRQSRSRSTSQLIQSRTATEEAGFARAEPARYISSQISRKWVLSPITFGASPPAQRIFRKQSEAQMLMQVPSIRVDLTPNLASGTVIRFGRPDDKLLSRIKPKEDTAPSGTQSQKPTQIQSVKYNELANMSFYQAKRRKPPDVSFNHPISTITTNYPNYESAKQFAARFQKPSARMESIRPKDWHTEQQTYLMQVIRASQVMKGNQADRAARMDQDFGHKQAMEKSADHTAPRYPKQISSAEPKADNKAIISEQADLSVVIESSKRRMFSSQQTHRAWPSAKSADRQTNTASSSSIQKRNKPIMGAARQRSISQTALNSPKLISSIGIQRKTEAIGIPRAGVKSNARSQSETDGLSPAPVQMLLNYVQDNQTVLEHKPGSDASASELSNQPLEMDWLRQNQAQESTPTETKTVEQPAPQLDMDQLKDLVKNLPQFDIKKIADRVYREIEKKIQFDRQRRGI
jgi:hypothetical protein